jgi:hypothetical protein
MSKGWDYDYHVVRARAELDCAYRAEGKAAAMAHMKLSALHMERARLAKLSELPNSASNGARQSARRRGECDARRGSAAPPVECASHHRGARLRQIESFEPSRTVENPAERKGQRLGSIPSIIALGFWRVAALSR